MRWQVAGEWEMAPKCGTLPRDAVNLVGLSPCRLSSVTNTVITV